MYYRKMEGKIVRNEIQEPKPSREELRRKLREKISGKRSTTSTPKQAKVDPQTTLLGMGIDDPGILNMANTLMRNPKTALKDLKTMIPES